MAPQNYKRATVSPIENLPLTIGNLALDQNQLTNVKIQGNGNIGKGSLTLVIEVSDLNQLTDVKDYLQNQYGM